MLLLAGCLAIILGIIHSILGEYLIFQRMRDVGIIPTNGGTLLKPKNVRILWASWHLVTVFGWALGSILCWLSLSSSVELIIPARLTNIITVAMLLGAILVLIGTKGKHPGWVVLTIIALSTWIGNN